MKKDIHSYWQRFLEDSGLSNHTEFHDAFAFGTTPQQAAHLLDLVLAGQKTATSSAVLEYEATGVTIPEEGNLSIVLDHAGQPSCVVETSVVHRLPFGDVDFNLCSKEGEDENLESWQHNHMIFFEEIAHGFGQKFTSESEIIFEEFKVVYRS